MDFRCSGEDDEDEGDKAASRAANAGKRISVETTELVENLCGLGWASKNSAIKESTRLSMK